jgi:hypothetical protein
VNTGQLDAPSLAAADILFDTGSGITAFMSRLRGDQMPGVIEQPSELDRHQPFGRTAAIRLRPVALLLSACMILIRSGVLCRPHIRSVGRRV